MKKNNKPVFRNFDLQVFKNEKILIKGKSGSGKTCLFKLLLGFEKPEKGIIRYNGSLLDKTSICQIRQQIFYLSQDIDLRNQPIGSFLHEILDQNQKPLKKDLLTRHLGYFDLDVSVLECMSHQLSGGERQRIGLILGILLDRPVWLLDEPTSALDDAMKAKTAEYVLNCKKTILIVSHDPAWQAAETTNSN